MISCPDRSDVYLAGALSSAEEAGYLDHLATCEACARSMHDAVQLRDLEDHLRLDRAAASRPRHPHPIAYAVVRRHDVDEPLEALPYACWWREVRLGISAVAIVVDRGYGATADEIRASLELTILDPAWRAEVAVCVDLLVMQLSMTAELGR